MDGCRSPGGRKPRHRLSNDDERVRVAEIQAVNE